MKPTPTRLRMVFPLLLVWLAGSAALAGPVVGTVLKAGGTQPLAKAEVELLRPGTEKIAYRGYTDVKGKFALRQVAVGKYEVRIKFGRVLEQVTEGQPTRRRMKISVGQKTIRLPVLRVR